MLIRYTTDILHNKPEKPSLFLYCTEWREVEADLDVLFNLFCVGHTVHISDKKETDAFILDLDHLTPEQADRVHSPAFLDEVKALFDAEEVILHDSASRQYNKQKIFVRKKYKRELAGNIDLAYQRFRLMFEEAFGLVCDGKMDRWTQLTWPSRDKDAAYTPSTLKATAAAHASHMPKIEDDLAETGEIGRINTEKRKKSPKSPLISVKMPETGRCIPLYQQAINSEFKKELRPDIWRLDFYPYFHVRGGERKALFIPEGKRNATVRRIIAAAVYNGHYLNTKKGAGYTAADALWTVHKVIEAHFESPAAFWGESGGKLSAEIAAAWAECGENYQKFGERNAARMGYSPRSHQADVIWEANKDALLAAHPALVQDMISRMCFGVEADEAAVYRKWRANTKKLGQVRTRGHSLKGEEDYSAYAAAPKDERGRVKVPRRLQHNPRFRAFAKAIGLRCSWTDDRT